MRLTSDQATAVTLRPHFALAPSPSRQYLTGKKSSAVDKKTAATPMSARRTLWNKRSPARPAITAIAMTT